MTTDLKSDAFGDASACTTLQEVIERIRTNSHQKELRSCTAAYGMTLQASRAIRDTAFFEDSRFVLDQISYAKAEMDIAAWHASEVVVVTATILSATQDFLDQETIGGTEWPTPIEITEFVIRIAIAEVESLRRP